MNICFKLFEGNPGETEVTAQLFHSRRTKDKEEKVTLAVNAMRALHISWSEL